MSRKPKTEQGPGQPGPASLLELFAMRVAAGDRDTAPILFRAVAEVLRSRLRPEDAAVVATWFDRMAAGESPTDVLTPSRAGRPKGKTSDRGPMANGRIPDDIDVAWIVRQNLAIAQETGVRPGVVYAGVAKALKMSTGTVRNIYSRLKDELG